MSMINYSVIIPHFNDAERLERLLVSLPKSRGDVEIIVVDDCSQDQAGLAAVQSAWPHVRWLSTPENVGSGGARNIGLHEARGRWLVFADSDDEFLLGAFDIFDRVLRDGDELVYFLAEAVQEVDGSPSVRSELLNELVETYARAPSPESLQQLRLDHVVPWAKVYAHTFIKSYNLLFDVARHSNDVAFNVLAAVQTNRIKAEPISVYRLYRRRGSLTSNLTKRVFMARFQVSRSVSQRLSKFGIRRVISATGYMVLSLGYGPSAALQVWSQAVCSPMKIEWRRIFEMSRWKQFFARKRNNFREISK